MPSYYIGAIPYSAENHLRHFGILGMKWGVRRFENYNGTLTAEGRARYSVDSKSVAAAQQRQAILNRQAQSGQRSQSYREAHTIPKGTTIYRTTANEDEDMNGTKYVSYLDADRNHYNSGWIKNMGNTGKAYEHSFTATEDIKVPGRDELREVINNAVKSNKLEKITAEKWFDVAMPKGTWARIEALQNYDVDENKASKLFVNNLLKNYRNMTSNEAYFFAAQTLGLNNKLKDSVIAELKKRGYNAMTDEASVGGQNNWGAEGMDPLILFNGSSLQKTGTRRIKDREERKSGKRYQQWYNEANRNRRNGANW